MNGYPLMCEIIFTIDNPRIPPHSYGAPSSPLSTVEDNAKIKKHIREKRELKQSLTALQRCLQCLNELVRGSAHLSVGPYNLLNSVALRS